MSEDLTALEGYFDAIKFYNLSLAGYSFSQTARERAERDCEKFLRMARPLLDKDDALYGVGVDFYMTRCGIGGFWDGAYRSAEALTALAKTFGKIDAYVGIDDSVVIGDSK